MEQFSSAQGVENKEQPERILVIDSDAVQLEEKMKDLKSAYGSLRFDTSVGEIPETPPPGVYELWFNNTGPRFRNEKHRENWKGVPTKVIVWSRAGHGVSDVQDFEQKLASDL